MKLKKKYRASGIFNNGQRLGFTFVILAGILWGTTGTLTKYIFAYGLDPLMLAGLRISLSFLALALFAALSGSRIGLKGSDLPFFLLFGVVSVAIFNIFYLSAIQLTNVSTAVVLLYTAPAFSVLMARSVLREKLTFRKTAAVLLTIIGVALMVGAYRPGHLAFSAAGILSGLGAGFTFGIYSVFTKEALRRGYGSLETVILALGSGLLFLALLRPPWVFLPLVHSPVMMWLLVLAVAIFCTMLPYILFVAGLRHMEAGKATLSAAVEPVVAILLAVALLGETLAVPQIAGVLIVLAAINIQS
jgi:drug/metabolite transporter (DMT)-like permease